MGAHVFVREYNGTLCFVYGWISAHAFSDGNRGKMMCPYSSLPLLKRERKQEKVQFYSSISPTDGTGVLYLIAATNPIMAIGTKR